MNLCVMSTINQPIYQLPAVLVVREMGSHPQGAQGNQIEHDPAVPQAEAEVAAAPTVRHRNGFTSITATSLLEYSAPRSQRASRSGITRTSAGLSRRDPEGVITFLYTPVRRVLPPSCARAQGHRHRGCWLVAATKGVKCRSTIRRPSSTPRAHAPHRVCVVRAPPTSRPQLSDNSATQDPTKERVRTDCPSTMGHRPRSGRAGTMVYVSSGDATRTVVLVSDNVDSAKQVTSAVGQDDGILGRGVVSLRRTDRSTGA